MYETNSGLFSIELSCNLCGSDNITLYYDKNKEIITVMCECGNKDYISISDIENNFSEVYI